MSDEIETEQRLEAVKVCLGELDAVTVICALAVAQEWESSLADAYFSNDPVKQTSYLRREANKALRRQKRYAVLERRVRRALERARKAKTGKR